MPPKAPPKVAPGKKEPPKKKPKKSQLLQMAMDQATDDAHKLYKQHDVSRVSAESKDKLQRDHLQLDFTIEAERIAKERVIFGEVKKSLIEAEKLVYKEHEKHMQWKHVPDASRLPDVQRESDINTFLSVWRDYEAEQDTYHPETVVIAAKNATIPPPMPGAVNQTHSMLFIRGEQGIAVAKRRGMIDDELSRCLAAYQLAEVIENERDKVASLRLQEKMNFHDGNLRKVYEQVMRSLDFMTINTLLYYDAIIDDPEGETLMKLKPEINPVIKFGLWVKVKEITRSFTSLVFPYVEIRFDPKSNAQPKLPKALGLIKENVAVRVVQLSFDPYSGYGLKGKRYYALSCTVKVDLLTFQDRPKDCGEYLIRGETTSSHTLHYEEYPPKISETREDPGFRISFDVPSTLVIRQPTLLIGKWTPSLGEWEPCSHTIFGATFGGTARVDANPRRATFVTGELAHFAVLQEKVFDALFERWSFRPLTYDRLLFTLEGRRRNDPSDREFRILVEDAFCKLLAPDDEELEELRENWLEPTTLFRRLSQAGFNFILDDDDAKYMDGVLPKSEALEMKAYADMAQFCQYYSICSSKHNKLGEDADMALFRVSKQARGIEEEIDIYDIREDDTEEYHSIRYRRDNCVLAKFTEEEEKPDLNIKDECETHYNLYTLFLTLAPEEELRQQMDQTNFLLRRCVYQLLRLVRPLSWG